MKKVVALLMISTILAGCTEVIPDPEDVFSECPSPDWIKVDDEVTWMLDNNSTMPVVDLGNETMLFQLDYFTYTASHTSFTFVNNTVIFDNTTFESKTGHVNQGGLYVSTGYGTTGSAILHFPDFGMNMTYDYDVRYRLWDGSC